MMRKSQKLAPEKHWILFLSGFFSEKQDFWNFFLKPKIDGFELHF